MKNDINSAMQMVTDNLLLQAKLLKLATETPALNPMNAYQQGPSFESAGQDITPTGMMGRFVSGFGTNPLFRAANAYFSVKDAPGQFGAAASNLFNAFSPTVANNYRA